MSMEDVSKDLNNAVGFIDSGIEDISAGAADREARAQRTVELGRKLGELANELEGLSREYRDDVFHPKVASSEFFSAADIMGSMDIAPDVWDKIDGHLGKHQTEPVSAGDHAYIIGITNDNNSFAIRSVAHGLRSQQEKISEIAEWAAMCAEKDDTSVEQAEAAKTVLATYANRVGIDIQPTLPPEGGTFRS
jgi:hypothetical protein